MKPLIKFLNETSQHLNGGVLNINESKIDEIMLKIRNMPANTQDDLEEAQYDMNKIPDNDLLKFTEEFFWMLIHEAGGDISNKEWYNQSKEDPNYGRPVKGILFAGGYSKYSPLMFPEDEDGMSSIKAICIDSSKKVNILTLIEHPGGKSFIHYFPLKDLIKNPNKKHKTPGAISEYIVFGRQSVVDIILEASMSYICEKYEINRRTRNTVRNVASQPTYTTQPATQSEPQSIFQHYNYTSISQFRRDFPEREIYKILIELGIKKKYDRLTFRRDLFDNSYKEFGNDWNSHIEAIHISGSNKVSFEVYVQGDSTDDTVMVSYDDFTKNTGNVTIVSHHAEVNAVYDEKTRLMILNTIASLLSDAVDGNKVFY